MILTDLGGIQEESPSLDGDDSGAPRTVFRLVNTLLAYTTRYKSKASLSSTDESGF